MTPVSAPRIFFEIPSQWRAWLAEYSATEPELRVGFYKRQSGRPTLSWPEAVDEALCFGWIDGVRRNIDAQSYEIRFTPRKVTSTWSAINIERVRVLESEGRMQAAGLAAFSQRRAAKSKIYSYEQAQAAKLSRADEALFRQDKGAWTFFQAQPPGYRHLVIWRILSAKRAGTRASRLANLIAASAKQRRL